MCLSPYREQPFRAAFEGSGLGWFMWEEKGPSKRGALSHFTHLTHLTALLTAAANHSTFFVLSRTGGYLKYYENYPTM